MSDKGEIELSCWFDKFENTANAVDSEVTPRPSVINDSSCYDELIAMGNKVKVFCLNKTKK